MISQKCEISTSQTPRNRMVGDPEWHCQLSLGSRGDLRVMRSGFCTHTMVVVRGLGEGKWGDVG